MRRLQELELDVSSDALVKVFSNGTPATGADMCGASTGWKELCVL